MIEKKKHLHVGSFCVRGGKGNQINKLSLSYEGKARGGEKRLGNTPETTHRNTVSRSEFEKQMLER